MVKGSTTFRKVNAPQAIAAEQPGGEKLLAEEMLLLIIKIQKCTYLYIQKRREATKQHMEAPLSSQIATQVPDRVKHGTTPFSPGYDSPALPQAPIHAQLKSTADI